MGDAMNSRIFPRGVAADPARRERPNLVWWSDPPRGIGGYYLNLFLMRRYLGCYLFGFSGLEGVEASYENRIATILAPLGQLTVEGLAALAAALPRLFQVQSGSG